MEKNRKYVVVSGYYDNKTGAGHFIQAIGVYDNAEQAYGSALLHLNESADGEKGETISHLYELECTTGYGMDVKHEHITDYAYVLFCEA